MSIGMGHCKRMHLNGAINLHLIDIDDTIYV